LSEIFTCHSDDRPKSITRILVLIFLAGFAFRIWGLNYGLPYLYHPDEPVGASIALKIFKTHDLNPHFFDYGSFFIYLNSLAYFPYYLLGRIIGLFNTPADIPDLQILNLGIGRTLLRSQILLGRLITVFWGLSCIYLGYFLGNRLSGRKVGLLSALLIAISAPMVLHSQLITPNMGVTCMILFTLTILIHLTPQSPWRYYALIGIGIGLAVAIKYNAVWLLIPFGVSVLLLFGRATLFQPKAYFSLLIAGVTFLAATPYALLDSTTFMEETIRIIKYYAVSSHAGMEGNTTQFYLSYLIRDLGPIVFLSPIPIFFYFKNRNVSGLILTAYALPYLTYIFNLRIRNDRTLVLALPILLIFAADALQLLYRRIKQINSERYRLATQGIFVILATLFLTYPVWRTFEQHIQRTLPDAREYSRVWIEKNLPPGTRIAAESYVPFIDPSRFSVTFLNSLINHDPDWYVAQGFSVLVLSSGMYNRFYSKPERYGAEIGKYQALLSRFQHLARFDQNNITIKILSTSPK